MRKNKWYMLGICCVTGVLFISGCQATPKDVTVVKKDSNQMVAKAKSGEAKKYVLPSSYTDSYTNTKKNIKVNVDAKFDMDPSKGYPIIEVSKREFTDDEVKRFIDVFTEGKPFYKVNETWTKTDIQNRIIELKKQLNESGDDVDISGKKISKVIKELKEKLKTAPDSEKEELASKKLVAYGKSGGSRVYGYCKGEGNQKSYLQVDNSCISDEVVVTYTNFKNPLQDNYMPDGENQKYPNNITIDKPSISKNEVKKQAKELVEKLGIKDMDVSKIQTVLDYTGLQTALVDNKKANISAAYEVLFSRKYNGILSNLNSDSIVITQLGKKDEEQLEKSDNDNSGNEEYAPNWEAESIAVLIDDSGVIGFRYASPYKIGKTIINNSKLLPFDGVKKVMKKMLLVQNDTDDGDTKLTIDVKTMSMGLQKVKQKGEKTSALIVPVWTIIGDKTYDYGKGNGEKTTMKEEHLLQINGVDGSVIDAVDDN